MTVIVPTISIVAVADSVTEGETARFSLTSSPAPPSPMMVDIEVSTMDNGLDAATENMEVEVGTDGQGELLRDTADDDLQEPPGSIVATVLDSTGYAVSDSQGSAQITVNDNEPPVPMLTISEEQVSEGARWHQCHPNSPGHFHHADHENLQVLAQGPYREYGNSKR